jgi:hypothetical protein
MSMLGATPSDERAREEWMSHISVVAAYRDQHQVMSDNPRQVLGPYPEPGRAGYKTYWDAASSVLAARRAAGLDRVASGQRAPDPVTAQVAADIYRSLPESERAEIAAAVARNAGVLWLGDRSEPDEDAVVRMRTPGTWLANWPSATRKYITTPSSGHGRRQVTVDAPLEADLARSGRPNNGRSSQRKHAVQPDVGQSQSLLTPPHEMWQYPVNPMPGR